VLAREAKTADWGAGHKSQIQYRFRIDELEVTEDATVVKVRCAATGWLPKGRNAKSRLAFGGAPKERTELVRRVLAIVARGVVTRLAELERQRRLASH
jgi:translation initiation factor IF-3